MANQTEVIESGLNPLDAVEEVLADHNWAYSRTDDDRLIVQVAAHCCTYRLYFIWQEGLAALQFSCEYDLKVCDTNAQIASAVLMDVNESLWLGHFEIARSTMIPTFRQTCLMRGHDNSSSGSDFIQDLVDIALTQCERYFPVFHILSAAETANAQNLSLALMDTAGES